MRTFNVITLFLICLYINTIKAIVVISLGGDCTVASILRDTGIRKAAYPFDWMLAHFISVYRSVEDDFQKFLDEATLKIADDDKRIIVNAYGISFVHDFPTVHHSAALTDTETHEWNEIRSDWRNFIVPIREKYQRRIERFKSALSGSEHVFLIRYGVGESEKDLIIQFRDLLIKRYPNLNFTFVAVGGAPELGKSWDIEKIKNFYVIYGGPHFLSNWRNIFDSLGINSANSRSCYSQDDEEDDLVCDGTCHHNFK